MTRLSDLLPPQSLGEASAVQDLLPGLAPRLRGRIEVEALVRPGSTEEAASVLAWAARERVRVLLVGSGAHLPPFVLPGPWVVLSTERLADMERYEPADLTFTAGAGARLSVLAEALGAQRQWLPFDPPGFARRSLGGLVAAGVSGPLATGYGELRNHVLGATAVFGDGRIVRLGGRVVKNVAGFDLLRPLVGSQGSLALMTSVSMRVFPVPEVDRMLVREDADLAGLIAAARALQTAPVLPAAAVLALGARGDDARRPRLLVRLHGARASVDADQRTLERHAGSAFEVHDGDQAEALRRAMADHPERPGVGVATALPARLREVIEALGAGADASRAAPPLTAELFGARVRFGFDSVRDVPWPELRQELERLGGTLGVERVPPGEMDLIDELAEAVSRPSAGERVLADRVRTVYDPAGVLRGAPAMPDPASASAGA